MTNIAILGWGSLIWEDRPEFDAWRGYWCFDGPNLQLEFSRISKTRQGALTLVIDRKHGTPCKVAYALSRRRNPEDAICDLRCREGTSLDRIGIYFSKEAEECTKATPKSIEEWCHGKGLDAVIWTDLPSNFEQCYGEKFCTEKALKYIDSLPPVGKEKAMEYFSNTPDFIKTDLLSQIRSAQWNKKL